MSPRSITPVLIVAALSAAAPMVSGEITSDNHPSLQRALAESPAADKDANGSLSLDEYTELLKHQRPNDPENPKAPLLPVQPDGTLIVNTFENNNVLHPPAWSPVPQHGIKNHPPDWRTGGNWVRTGEAFNRDLQSSTKMMKRRVGPHEGKFFVTSAGNSVQSVGSLTSPVFLLELDYVLVSMSGGGHPGKVCVNIHTKDGIVRSATGSNDDYFEMVAIDVREFRGQFARIELCDQHRGLWGYLNVDTIHMTSEAGDARVVNDRPAPAGPEDGLVLTTTGRLHGAIKLENGQLTSGGQPVADPVILAINSDPKIAPPLKGAVRLRNGEIWRAEVGNIEGAGRRKTLAIQSRTFGAQKIPLSSLASMEFVAAHPTEAREPETLYRTDGAPIPGKLIWVRAKDIAIRSPLGIVPIPRESVLRYGLAKPAPAAVQTTDEIGLLDGSLLYGKTSFSGNQLLITHEVLGELKIDWSSVRYLRRNPAGLTWLDTVERTVMESVGPALPPPHPRLHLEEADSHLRSLRIMPHTVVSMRFPSPHGGSTFRGQLHSVPGSRAPLKVTLLDGESEVWSRQLPANHDPISLSIPLPRAEELTLRVEFDGPISFPCGIDLRDAHVLRLSELRTEP